jgi:transcriptional regulator with XRE-family HTH domain
MERKTPAVLKALGLRIRELRMRCGFTQEGAAEKLGMLAPNYARIEQGRMNATVDTLVRISEGLKIPIYEMFKRPAARRARPGRPRSV